jgi:MHS family proline/betaine transporter-like MFS transporter
MSSRTSSLMRKETMQGTLSSNVAISVDTLARQRRRAILATVLGNGLEWFDFTVYSFFAVIIAKLFFPTGNELTSLLLAVATFGVGFFMRPVGGMVLGVYGTKGSALADQSVDGGRHCTHRPRADL